MKRYPSIPHLIGNPLFGRLFSFLKPNGPLNNFIEAGKLAAKHPTGMCQFYLGFQPVLFITKPEHIKQLVIEQKLNVSSQEPLKLLKIFFGSCIFVDSEQLFEKKKIIYAKWLTKQTIMADYEANIKAAIERCLAYISASGQNEINLNDLTRKFTLAVVLKSTMQFLDIDEHTLTNVGNYLEKINTTLFSVKNVFKWNLPSVIRHLTSRSARPEKIKKELQSEFKKIILDGNEEKIKTTESFLRDIWKLSDKQLASLKNEMTKIFGDANAALVAGVETTSSTLQFLIKLLAAHPQIQVKLRDELREKLRSSATNQLTISEIYQLPYLNSVVKETLRLYPPAVAVLRTAKNHFKISDISVRPGEMIIFSTYVTHRLQNVWGDDIELFNPDRFLVDNKNMNDAFVPFSRGPHACIGRDLALIESKAFICALLLDYQIEIAENDFQLSLEKGALRPKLPTLTRFVPLK